jgi:hypothetical protein
MNTDRILEHFGRHWDVRRLKRHFERVEQHLRMQDVSSQPETLQLRRAQCLNRLHDYWRRGKFPRNYDQPRRYAPCFVDRDGTVCAVAHLMIEGGQTEMAQQIVHYANYATIPEMTFPELDVWAVQSGLTREELALIQPSYPDPQFLQEISRAMWLSGAMFLAGIIALFGNLGFNLINKRLSSRGFLPALLFGIILVSAAIYHYYRIASVMAAPSNPFINIAETRNIATVYSDVMLACGVFLTVGSLSFILFNKIKSSQRHHNKAFSVSEATKRLG